MWGNKHGADAFTRPGAGRRHTAAGNETYLLFPLSAPLLRRDQRLVVGAALGCEVDFGQRVVHQRHGQIDPVDVQPADEVPGLVHALHLHFHLEEEQSGRRSALRGCT